MQYHPKLKKAMKEIQDILSKYDIAGAIIIHAPGFTEFNLRIDPSYSCARFEGNGNLRIKAKIKEDFNGDKTAMEQKVKDTANMLYHLSDISGRIALNLFEISDRLDKETDATHFGKGYSSDTQQNN